MRITSPRTLPLSPIKILSSTSYDSTKVPNDKEKDERSRQKSRVFSKLLEALNSQEIEGQKSRKESVQTAVQGILAYAIACSNVC